MAAAKDIVDYVVLDVQSLEFGLSGQRKSASNNRKSPHTKSFGRKYAVMGALVSLVANFYFFWRAMPKLTSG